MTPQQGSGKRVWLSLTEQRAEGTQGANTISEIKCEEGGRRGRGEGG